MLFEDNVGGRRRSCILALVASHITSTCQAVSFKLIIIGPSSGEHDRVAEVSRRT